jgi:transcriptional regulator with XRE-family HTH domain
MRRRPKQPAPEGFLRLLEESMAKRKLSLNEVARRASLSPAFLSRILNKERGLPSDKAILRLARVLDLEPPERLLLEAGRIPEELRPAMRQPQMPNLLRATGELSEEDFQDVIRAVQAVILKLHRKKEPT